MILRLLLLLAVSTSFAKPKASKGRKPTQSATYYFSCDFRAVDQPQSLFEVSVRTPTDEEEISYKKSNRSHTLYVKVLKSGFVQYMFYQERPKTLLSSGSTTTDFLKEFEISATGVNANYKLECK